MYHAIYLFTSQLLLGTHSRWVERVTTALNRQPKSLIYLTCWFKTRHMTVIIMHVLLGIKWYEFVRNDDVRRLTKQPKLTAIIQSRRPRRLTMFGHIVHVDDNAYAKRILLASPPTDWRRQPGRPCITWFAVNWAMVKWATENWATGKLGNCKFGNHFLVGLVKWATVNWATEKWSRFLIQRWLKAIVLHLCYCRNWENGGWKFSNVLERSINHCWQFNV